VVSDYTLSDSNFIGKIKIAEVINGNTQKGNSHISDKLKRTIQIGEAELSNCKRSKLFFQGTG